MKYSVAFWLAIFFPFLMKGNTNTFIITPQIFHCECRNPGIPFNSNLSHSYHIYLTSLLQVMAFLKNQWYLISSFMLSYKLFFSSVLKTHNTTVSVKLA